MKRVRSVRMRVLSKRKVSVSELQASLVDLAKLHNELCEDHANLRRRMLTLENHLPMVFDL